MTFNTTFYFVQYSLKLKVIFLGRIRLVEQLTFEYTQWPLFQNANSLKKLGKQEQILDFKYFLVSCHHTNRHIVGMGKVSHALKDSDELSFNMLLQALYLDIKSI